MICFCTRIYISFMYYLKIDGELKGNITTLINVQGKAIRTFK
jgi:hypothetical protein